QRGGSPMAREAHPANGDQGRGPGSIEGRGELHLWMPRVAAAPEAAGVLVSFIAALQAILGPVQPAVEPAQDLLAALDPDQPRPPVLRRGRTLHLQLRRPREGVPRRAGSSVRSAGWTE